MERLRLALIGLVLCLGLPHLGYGQARSYELVGGEVLVETLRGHKRGQYLAVRPVGRRDTLWLWMEGVTRSRGPSREDARAADLVVWCYPQQYEDKRHVLPSAEEVTVATQREDGKRWVWFLSSEMAKRVIPDSNSRTRSGDLFLPP